MVLLLQMTTLENHDLSDAAKRAAESWRQLAQVPKLCSDFREMDSSASDDNIARGTPSPVWAVKEYLHLCLGDLRQRKLALMVSLQEWSCHLRQSNCSKIPFV
jgi:hypothetical protein